MTQKLWRCTSLFFAKMVEKLIHQRGTHNYSGWDYLNEDILKRKLHRNIESRDWVDVANIAMMLDYHDYRRRKETKHEN